MTKLNLHGREINLKSLYAASKETSRINRGYFGLFYDRSTGEVWSKYHCDSTLESWTEYDDADIIHVGNVVNHISAQTLADMIDRAISDDDFYSAYLREAEAESKAWEAQIEAEYSSNF